MVSLLALTLVKVVSMLLLPWETEEFSNVDVSIIKLSTCDECCLHDPCSTISDTTCICLGILVLVLRVRRFLLCLYPNKRLCG